MDKDLFRTDFEEDKLPSWHCPTCIKGILKLDKESLRVLFDNETAVHKDGDYFDYEFSSYVFHGHLYCNHCKENVVFSGACAIDQVYDDQGDGDPYTASKYVRMFSPRYFFPPLRLIQLPNNDEISDELKRLISKSFELYWCDADACAARIRATIELLLDGLGIQKNYTNGRKMHLHKRITKISNEVSPEVKEFFEAIKWMGNAGAHELDGIYHEQVLDAFEMLEHCLKEIYPSKDNLPLLLKLAKKINETTRPSF